MTDYHEFTGTNYWHSAKLSKAYFTLCRKIQIGFLNADIHCTWPQKGYTVWLYFWLVFKPYF